MNERERRYLNLLVDIGTALCNEGRKTNIDQDGLHSIVIEPETGYVDAYILIDGVQHHAHRLEQFPEIKYETIDVRRRDESTV